MKVNFKAIAIIACTLLYSSVFAQKSVYYKDGLPKDLKESLFATPKQTQWFKDAKFGVFVHWGSYVLEEVPASWGRKGKRPGAGKEARGGVPHEKYDLLYKKFNPVKFNADEWIKMVKDAGAKYFIFTTKHHDGFCMFDAHNTEYKITNSPFGRDVAKEIADACHKHGVKLFWYYSQPDWTHPDCLGENHENYRKYMFEHLRQLLTEYGKIDGVFFDGLGTRYHVWDTPNMVKMMRELQPGILINRRWGAGIPGVEHSGDYDTPEQEFGHFERGRPWEMCATIAQAWSWTGAERIKTPETNFKMMIWTAGSGGNLALNTGPKPDGTINAPEKEVYRVIGEWFKKNEETVRGTTAGPFLPSPWGVSTCKDNKVYLHVLTDFSKKQVINLPALPVKVKSAKLRAGGKVDMVQKNGRIQLTIEPDHKLVDQIIELTCKKNVESIEVVEDKDLKVVPFSEMTASSESGKFTTKMLLSKSEGAVIEGKKHKGWWSSSKSDKKPVLTVSFSKKEKLTYLTLAEQIRNASTRDFTIEYNHNGKWVECYKGDEIGLNFGLHLNGITTDKLRITFNKIAEKQAVNIGMIKAYSLVTDM